MGTNLEVFDAFGNLRYPIDPNTIPELQTPQTPYDRLLKERADLNEKIEKLIAFLNSDKINTISNEQLGLLYRQRNIMIKYLEILDTRIKLF